MLQHPPHPKLIPQPLYYSRPRTLRPLPPLRDPLPRPRTPASPTAAPSPAARAPLRSPAIPSPPSPNRNSDTACSPHPPDAAATSRRTSSTQPSLSLTPFPSQISRFPISDSHFE